MKYMMFRDLKLFLSIFLLLLISDLCNENLFSKSAKKAGPVEHIDAKERLEAIELVNVGDPINKEIQIFKAKIRGAFDEEKYEFLDKTAEGLRKSKEVFKNGVWKLEEFYEGLDNRFHTGEDGFLTDINNYNKWIESNPKSVTAHIGLADLYVSYAWKARGSGYSETVSQRMYKLFQERLKLAKQELEISLKISNNDVCWGTVALRVALGQNASKSEMDSIVAQTVKIDPDFWIIYVNRAYSLLPRWYGKPGEWEAYAKKISEEHKDGAEIYARIIIRLCRFYGSVFRDASASWPIAKKGLTQLLDKYPESLEIINYTARIATVGRDRKLAKEMFDKLGNTYLHYVWRKPERFVHFKTWAETGKW